MATHRSRHLEDVRFRRIAVYFLVGSSPNGCGLGGLRSRDRSFCRGRLLAVRERAAGRARAAWGHRCAPGIAGVDQATAGRALPFPCLPAAQLFLALLAAALFLGFALQALLFFAGAVLVFGAGVGESLGDRLPLAVAEAPPHRRVRTMGCKAGRGGSR